MAARPATVLLTGATGALGAAVLRRLADEGAVVVALGRSRPAIARLAMEARAAVVPLWGDVTAPLCGVRADDLPLLSEVRRIVHAAADTRWHGAPRDLYAANVDGLQNLLDLCERAGLPPETEVVHVSTAYVCGRRTGLREAPQEAAPQFNNAYEASKFLAERTALGWAGHQVRVVRPSTIVGDSRSGRTERFRGLYFFLEQIWRDQLRIAPGASGTRLDIVPADYVAGFLMDRPDGAPWPRVTHAVAGDLAPSLGEIWEVATAAFNAVDHGNRRPGAFVPTFAVDPVLRLAGLIPGAPGRQARRTRRFLGYVAGTKSFEARFHETQPPPRFAEYGPPICEQAAAARFQAVRVAQEPAPSTHLKSAPEPAVLLTGASGLLGAALARRLVRQGRPVIAVCRGRGPASGMLADLERQGLLTLLRADLRLPHWGCAPGDLAELGRRVRWVVHAAGAYDLAIDSPAAEAGNVTATRRLLEEVRRWDLASFHHVSSITVAGRWREHGAAPEAFIAAPGPFRNAYERSKWEGEGLVAANLPAPTRIYRPGIIVGDSLTGWTSKFDGPYPAFTLMRPGGVFPIAGAGRDPFPLVNVDLVADAIAAGLDAPPEQLEFVHAIDSDLLSLRSFAEAMCRRLAGHERVISLPPLLVEAVARIPGFQALTGVQKQSIAYMHDFGRFETRRFAELCAGRGVPTARLRGSLDALALYYALSTGRRFRGGEAAAERRAPALARSHPYVVEA